MLPVCGMRALGWPEGALSLPKTMVHLPPSWKGPLWYQLWTCGVFLLVVLWWAEITSSAGLKTAVVHEVCNCPHCRNGNMDQQWGFVVSTYFNSCYWWVRAFRLCREIGTQLMPVRGTGKHWIQMLVCQRQVWEGYGSLALLPTSIQIPA